MLSLQDRIQNLYNSIYTPMDNGVELVREAGKYEFLALVEIVRDLINNQQGEI